ncbi:MAG: hypothetical protein NWT04_06185, partial [Verrucomicrobiales bacterium]|nr:hypothetical protein [Verrucomicrobiales bacterium]
MSARPASVLAIVFLFTSVAGAAEAEVKRPPRPKPIVSPVIGENGKVTFQIKAPAAKEVSVTGQMASGKLDLTREASGLWTGTLESVAPGIY